MIMVKLDCVPCASRDPDYGPVEFAWEFEPRPTHRLMDTQADIDKNFHARCGVCFAKDWQVIGVTDLEMPALHAI